jgi:pimeloyl-ACP methyl ester carboxylesterase
MIESAPLALPHGITLECRSSGERGRPVLVFLHGFPEAAFVWDELLAHFSRPEHGGYRCVAPNLRGYAGSSAPAEVKDYRAKHLVQDILALIEHETGGPQGQLAALVAHDWGGALAWNLAALNPGRLPRLCIINSPHPGTFLRELQHSPEQQAASAYMNFLCRPDAARLLAEDDFRRLWPFFTNMGAIDGPHAWLSETAKDQYRAVWRQGLDGALNYYRASPLRPPTGQDPGARAVTLPREMLEVNLPTHVLWAMGDIALPPGLLTGLQDFVPQLRLTPVAEGTHWLVHEQPRLVIDWLAQALRGA